MWELHGWISRKAETYVQHFENIVSLRIRGFREPLLLRCQHPVVACSGIEGYTGKELMIGKSHENMWKPVRVNI